MCFYQCQLISNPHFLYINGKSLLIAKPNKTQNECNSEHISLSINLLILILEIKQSYTSNISVSTFFKPPSPKLNVLGYSNIMKLIL